MAQKEYDASSITIQEFAKYPWQMAIALAEQFNANPILILRGLEVCQLAGEPFDYYIDKYLKKIDLPLNELVDTIYRERQKNHWR